MKMKARRKLIDRATLHALLRAAIKRHPRLNIDLVNDYSLCWMLWREPLGGCGVITSFRGVDAPVVLPMALGMLDELRGHKRPPEVSDEEMDRRAEEVWKRKAVAA